jgi:alpha-tubulin suppressor-like RCC1 family protein
MIMVLRGGRGVAAVLAAAGAAVAMVLAGAAGGGLADAATRPAGLAAPVLPHLPGVHRPDPRVAGVSPTAGRAARVGRAGRLAVPAGVQDGVSSLLGWGQNSYGQLGNGATVAGQSVPVAASLPPDTQITQVTGGYDHSLAVTSDGGVLAFGHNGTGQLGNGTTTDSDTPVNVSLPPVTNVTQAAAGFGFSLAVTSSGGVLGWGDDEGGELGNGEVTGSPVTTPVSVSLPAGTSVTQVAAGIDDFSLALTSSGQVLAWGNNFFGELGNGTTTSSDTPVEVSLPSGVTVTQVAAGADDGYALTSTGAVYAWGYGAGGTLGDGSTASSDTPVLVSVPSGTSITQIAGGGSFAMALTSAGQVLAWGGGGSGQLGDGSTAGSDVPVAVSLPSGVTAWQIAAGGSFGLASTTTGSVLAWGDNVWGELGDGTTTGSDTPVTVSLPSGFKADTLAAGYFHALALPAPVPQVTGISADDGLPAGGGTVTITGSGFTGATAVDFGSTKASSFTVVNDGEITAKVPAGTGLVNITVTALGGTSVTSPVDEYTYLAKGAVLGWGYNGYGELGDSQFSNAVTPVAALLPAGTVVTAVARGDGTTYALTSAGTVYAWGYDYYGDLGNGTTSTTDTVTPVKVSIPAGTVVKAIAAGYYNGYALTSTGQVLAWGYNDLGDLGNGTTTDSDVPVTVSLPSGTTVTSLGGQAYGAAVLTSAGAVYDWGYGEDGVLGNGSTANSDVPVKVELPSGTTVKSMFAAQYGGFVLTSAGTALGWGYNGYGELGDGTTTSTDVPVTVSLPSGSTATAFAAGGYANYVLTSTGQVLAMGYGDDGELGDGATTDSDVPVKVSLPTGTTAAAISGGFYSGYALTSAGKVLAWGYNGEGDLGDGTTTDADVPVHVSLPAGVSVTELGPSLDDGGAAVVSPVTTVTGVSPSSGAAGITVTITGLNLKGATKVLFGSAAASFTVNSATKITATVPAGSGKVAVTVTTPLGTSAQTEDFTYTS